MSEPGFANVKDQLADWWANCKITRQKETIKSVAERLYTRKGEFYDPVQKDIGVPWYMVAVIDERESGASGGALHNGDPIIGTGKKTYHIPAERGPFATWHEAAIDALTMPGKNFDKVKSWNMPLVLYCLEAYNGWGYRLYHPQTPSPYMWSCTNIYDDSSKGKYVADGKWQAGVTDKQIGCVPLLKALLELNNEVVVEPKVVPTTIPSIPTQPIEDFKMPWFISMFIDSSKIGGWVRALLAPALAAVGTYLAVKAPFLGNLLTPEFQAGIVTAAVGVATGIWSTLTKGDVPVTQPVTSTQVVKAVSNVPAVSL